jgi:hypothetical protein
MNSTQTGNMPSITLIALPLLATLLILVIFRRDFNRR